MRTPGCSLGVEVEADNALEALRKAGVHVAEVGEKRYVAAGTVSVMKDELRTNLTLQIDDHAISLPLNYDDVRWLVRWLEGHTQ